MWLLFCHPLSEAVFSVRPASQRLPCCYVADDYKTMLAYVGGRQVRWSVTDCLREWFFGGRGRSMLVRLAPRDGMRAPPFLLEGRRVYPLPHYPPCNMRNSRINLGSSVVIIVIFLRCHTR
jgi:hypothetical protein